MMSVMFRFDGFDKVVTYDLGVSTFVLVHIRAFFFPAEWPDMVAFMDSAVVSFVSHGKILGYARYRGHTA
jgi:hypothetical protein